MYLQFIQFLHTDMTQVIVGSWVVSPRGDHSGCALVIARRSETTHSGVDVNNTHLSMINPLNIREML